MNEKSLQRIKMRNEAEKYPSYWRDPEVEEYYGQRLYIRNRNDRNRNWLEWIKGLLPEHSIVIDELLYKFN